MIKERRFRWTMTVIFASAAVVTVAGGYAYHKSVGEYVEVIKKSQAIKSRIIASRILLSTLMSAETGQRGYLLTGNQSYRKPFDDATRLIEDHLSNFKKNQPPERLMNVANIESAITTKLNALRKTIKLYDNNEFDAAIAIVRTDAGKDSMDTMIKIINNFIDMDNLIDDDIHEMAARKTTEESGYLFILNLSIFIGLTAGMAGLWRASKKIGELATRLQQEAHHDILTGLPNRIFLMETLHYVLALAGRENRRIGLLFLDLNGFKAINDELGHDKGDLALVLVARALVGVLRESDFAARLGGDEFTVIILTVDDVCIVCKRIESAISSVSAPELQGHRLGTSIGASLFPDDGTNIESLLNAADKRMFEQKRAKKTGVPIPKCPLCKGDCTLNTVNLS